MRGCQTLMELSLSASLQQHCTTVASVIEMSMKKKTLSQEGIQVDKGSVAFFLDHARASL